MEVKVLYNDYCLEIDGQRFRHHKNGGGLVGENTKVNESAYIGINAKVKDFATVEARAAIYGEVEVRDQAVIRSDVIIAGQTLVGGDAEIIRGFIDVNYAITSGKVDSGMSGYWGKVRKNLILPIEETETREFNVLKFWLINSKPY